MRSFALKRLYVRELGEEAGFVPGEEAGRADDADAGDSCVVEVAEVVLVACGQVVHAGCDSGGQDWAVLIDKHNVGRHEADVRVAHVPGPFKELL